MTKKYIGISGVARSGKDTFASILKNKLRSHGISADSVALAYELKRETQKYCQEAFGIDSFTTDTEEKAKIRPYLVEYGLNKRVRSEGKYWTRKLDDSLGFHDGEVIIVTDIRYSIYPEDEVQWLRGHKGKLVHVSRYDGGIENKVMPPNDHERFNDPILESLADFRVVWPTTDEKGVLNLFVDEFIRKHLWNVLWS